MVVTLFGVGHRVRVPIAPLQFLECMNFALVCMVDTQCKMETIVLFYINLVKWPQMNI